MIKRVIVIVVIVAFWVSAYFAGTFAPPPGPQADSTATSVVTAPFSAEEMEQTLSDFIGSPTGVDGDRRDRTFFTDKEKSAAEWLKTRLIGYGYDAEMQNIHYAAGFNSQNVIAKLKGKSSENSVVVGANYDNRYSEIGGLTALSSTGALQNGTGTAVVLDLARAMADMEGQLDFDVYFVLFGASEIGYFGSSKFLSSYLGQGGAVNVAAMFNIQRIGTGGIHFYSGELNTAHGKIVDNVSRKFGIGANRITAVLPRIDMKFTSMLPYAHRGLIGDHVPFVDSGIPVIGLVGGVYSPIGLDISESSGGTGISYTPSDTLSGLKYRFPHYGDRMAETAFLVYSTLLADGFLTAALSAKAAPENFAAFTHSSYAYLAVIIMFGLLMCALVLVRNRFIRLHPKTETEERTKIAVYGDDYED